ncbi:hypothetical protein [Geodermatophilus sp. SYSU D00700]
MLELVSETRLGSGQSLVSASGAHRVDVQPDGNVVAFGPDQTLIWETGTGGNPGAQLEMRTDGSLAVVSGTGEVLWESVTAAGSVGARTVLQDDGVLTVLADDGSVVWSSTVTELVAGMPLVTGQSLVSANAAYRATVRPDGNLVVLGANDVPVWDTATGGNPQARLEMRPDGDLILVSKSGPVLWQSDTAGSAAARAVLGDDGVLALLAADGTTVWSSS